MSRTFQGQEGSYASPTHPPAAGLFFFCSFLLLILLPASAYFEICATACLNGNPPAASVLQHGGVSVQPYHRLPSQDPERTVPREWLLSGKEIAVGDNSKD